MFLARGSDVAGRPSFFELIAEQYFVTSLEGAVQYGLALAARRFPFGAAHWHELFSGGLFALDVASVLRNEASFSESFYGLRRTDASGAALTRSAQLYSLLLSSGGPFIAHWLRRWRPLVRVMTLGTAAAEGVTFVLQLLYVFGLARCFSIVQWLCGFRLLRWSPADLRTREEVTQKWREAFANRFSSPVVRSVVGVAFALSDVAHLALPAAVFCFRFSEWWQSDEAEALRGSSTKEPITPPPPKPLPPLDPNLPEDPNVCPVCRKQRTNPAVSPSGYCCCYPCLFKHVRDEGVCPVTGIPCKVDRIVKLYEE